MRLTLKGVCRFESYPFRHGSIGHVASPPRSKRDSVKALAGSTPAATAKFGEMAEWFKAPALKTDAPSGAVSSNLTLSAMLWGVRAGWTATSL